MASRTLVFPWPLAPVMRFRPMSNAISCSARFRTPATCSFTSRKTLSDPHRHDDVAVVDSVRVAGSHEALRLAVLQLEPDLRRPHRLEELDQVARVEADLHR